MDTLEKINCLTIGEKIKIREYTSIDNIELNGILYTPEEFSERSIIHVHGLSGNYYQNETKPLGCCPANIFFLP